MNHPYIIKQPFKIKSKWFIFFALALWVQPNLDHFLSITVNVNTNITICNSVPKNVVRRLSQGKLLLKFPDWVTDLLVLVKAVF